MPANKYQNEVINASCRAYSVEAGAGSGKTKTSVLRVARLIADGVPPSRLCYVTFSNKSASEQRVRIAQEIFPDASDEEMEYFRNPKRDEFEVGDNPIKKFITDWVCTIHALSFRLLKISGMKFSVVADQIQREANSLIKDSIKELKYDQSFKVVMHYIDRAVLADVEPKNSYSFYASILNVKRAEYHAENLSELYKRYRSFCTSKNALDFTMMQVLCLRKLNTEPNFKSTCQGLFDHIIVDEAQDTDQVQRDIVFILGEKAKSIGLIGDLNQRMYGFRNALPAVMREDMDDFFGEVSRYRLPINYRSTKSVIEFGKKLILNNYVDEKMKKWLPEFGYPDNAELGKPPEFSTHDKFNIMCEEICTLINQTQDYGSWLILSRTRAECASIHTALIANKIPAINRVGGLLFGSPHIRKVLAYARLASNYNDARDDAEIVKEIANVATKSFIAPMTRRNHINGCTNDKPWIKCSCPTIIEEGRDHSHARYYGAKSVEQASYHPDGLWQGILSQVYEVNKGGYPTMSSKGAKDLVDFVLDAEKFKDDAHECLNFIINECVLPYISDDEGLDDEDLAENGKQEDFQLLTEMSHGKSIIEFLEEIDKLSTASSEVGSKDAVEIGTVHWSKGYERPKVIVNMTRMPIVPPIPKEDQLPVGRPNSLEEERCIAYVAVSRAREELYVMQSEEWMAKPAKSSIFMYELMLEELSKGE